VLGVSGEDVVRAAHAELRRLGKKLDERKALRNVLIDLYGEENLHAALKAYQRALPHVRTMGRWVDLVRQWEPEWDAAPEAARDLVNDLITVAGPRAARADQWFEYLIACWQWRNSRRMSWLREQRDRMANDEFYMPKLTPPRASAGAEAIKAALKKGPLTAREIAQKTGMTLSAVQSLLVNMIPREVVRTLNDRRRSRAIGAPEALFSLLGSTAKIRTYASHAIVAALIAAARPMTREELQIAKGPIRTIESAIFSLRRSGIVSIPRQSRGL
jgi:hypothetical protein